MVRKDGLAMEIVLDPDSSSGHHHDAHGRVVELVDTLASGASDRKVMRVRVSPRPPRQNIPNRGVFSFFD